METPIPRSTCLGFTHQGKPCRNLRGSNGYCSRHFRQKDYGELRNVDGLNETQIVAIVKKSFKRGEGIVIPSLPKETIHRELISIAAPSFHDSEQELIAKAFNESSMNEEERTEAAYDDFFTERFSVDKQKEKLLTYEDRLVRWDACLKKKEANLKEKEAVVDLVLNGDPCLLEEKFNEMTKAIDDFKAVVKRLREYRQNNLTECCVCYDYRLTKDELLSCGHPLCPNCKVNLPKPECPLCRKPLKVNS